MENEVDGWLVLGTRLDAKQLETDLKKEQRKLEQFDKENKKLTEKKLEIEAKIKIDDEEYKRKVKLLEKRYEAEIKKNTFGGRIDQDVETRINDKYDTLRENLDISHERSGEKQLNQLEAINKQISENEIAQQKSVERAQELSEALGEAKKKANISAEIRKVGSAIDKASKKMIRWGLYLVGIRSLFSAISQAMNIIKEDNEELNNEITFIKYTIAYELEPVIMAVVGFVKELLLLVGKLIYSLTGKDIFKETNERLKNSVKEAKELNKLTTGWDEMTILGDNKSSSNKENALKGGAGFPEMKDFDIYETKIAKVTQGITKDFLDLNDTLNEVVNNPHFFDESLGAWSEFGFGLTEIVSGLCNIFLGALEIIGGIGEMLVGLFTGDFKLVEEGWKITWDGIVNILQGALKIVMGAIDVVWGFIGEMFKEIIEWFDDTIDKMVSEGNGFFAGVLNAIKYIIQAVFTLVDGLVNSIRQIFDGLIKVFKGDFAEGFKQIGKGIGNALISILNAVIDLLNAVWTSLLAVVDASGKIFGKSWNLRESLAIPHIEYFAQGGIINAPGKGVPIGSYQNRGGEAGPEGVVPMSNEQQMELLGESIGRHVVINATIVNSMNGRVLSREIRRINTSDDFAFNK